MKSKQEHELACCSCNIDLSEIAIPKKKIKEIVDFAKKHQEICFGWASQEAVVGKLEKLLEEK